MPASILIVDDEKHTREGLQLALEDTYDVYLASNADQAFNLLDSQPFDVVLTDLRMSGKSGMKVIDEALSQSHKPIWQCGNRRRSHEARGLRFSD